MHCEKIETLTIISRSNAIMPGLLQKKITLVFWCGSTEKNNFGILVWLEGWAYTFTQCHMNDCHDGNSTSGLYIKTPPCIEK